MAADKKKWLFVINPVSGDIDKSDLKEEVKELLKGKDIHWDWMLTTGKDDLRQIKERIERYGPGTVIAGGGDGTIHMVAQATIPGEITLGILPLGSANGLATELQLPKTVHEALTVLLDGKTTALDVLKINDILCIHLCDIGLNATVVKRFDRSGYRGIFGYFRQYLKEIRGVSSKKFLIKDNNGERTEKALMVIATHSRHLGTGAIINPEGDPADGYFELCVMKRFPLWMVFRIAVAMFTGNIKKLKFVSITSHRELELENISGADFQVDGEPRPKTRLIRMSTHDKPLRVIIPEVKNDRSLWT